MKNVRLSKSLVVVGALLATGLAASMRAAPAAPARDHTQQMSQKQEAMTITAGELGDHPERYYGKRVKITGDVEDVYSRSVFSIDEDRLWSTGRDVLVLNPAAKERVTGNKSVTVQGTVRPFNYTDVDNYIVRHGWQWDLATVYHTRFARRPIVIADSIMTGANRELVMHSDVVRSSAEAYGKPWTGKTSSMPSTVVYTTPEDLSRHPDKYYGKTVSIIGNPEDTFGTQLFSIDEDRLWSAGQDVLVLATGVDRNWEDLAFVQVQGKVMRFTKDEVQRRIDKNRTLFPWFWSDYDNRPVIVADSILGPDGQNLMKGGVPRVP